jgi:hypothetical protein
MKTAFDYSGEIDIWYCEACSSAHLRAGDTALTFTREDFEVFTERVVDVNVRGWAGLAAPVPL